MRGQTTRSEQRVTRDLVMPSEFLGIPATNARSGLTGYYLSPFVGVYRRTLPLVSFVSGGRERAESVPDFLERPETDQYLEPWNGADVERLRLSQTLLQEKVRGAEQKPSVLELAATRRRVA
jgi:hypothetical protein